MRFLLPALAALAMLAACAPVIPPPRAGYDRRVDPMDPLERAPLAGKRIVIDPGHGGFFRGALGVKGLTEAEVNLGVALDLAALLRARGAEVLLTRESDRDFLTPADSSLRSDLAERVRMANASRPDLFVSVHHNADPRGAHDVNETQVYYQLGDEGPALEAAADVHRFLTRNLGIGASRLVSGNFAVLRGSDAPAILTESSYITYPPTEARLARADARQIEAEALALGIAAYFSRPRPVIMGLSPIAAGYDYSDTAFATGFVRLGATLRGACDLVALTVDGAPVKAEVTPGEPPLSFLAWQPGRPLAAGSHEATLLVRLAGEGTSRRARARFAVEPRAESLAIEFPDQPFWDGQQLIGARLRALSREGVLVRDSLSIRVTARGRVTPQDTTVTLRDGVAWCYFARAARSRTVEPPKISLRARLAADPKVSALATLAIDERHVPDTFPFFARRMPEDAALTNAPGTREPEPTVRWINRDGFAVRAGMAFAIGARAEHGSVNLPALAGYREWRSDTLRPARFVAIAGGALHNRRIVVDPAGGGDDPAGVSASGTRGASANLEVARMLQGMLEAAGAEVRLTRTSDVPVSEFERVRTSESFRADRFVRIGHPAAAPRLGHYFSSAVGRRWAGNLADFAARLGLPRPTIGDDAQYPIQQSSATALFAALGRVDSTGGPFGAFDPVRLRREAYAIYLSLAREWTAADWAVDTLAIVDAAGRPRAGLATRLGGALVFESDSLGHIAFFRTEPGPMLVEAVDSTARTRRVLLDSDRGIVPIGPTTP